MSRKHQINGHHLSVPRDQPLIGVILEEQGREIVHYFTEETIEDSTDTGSNIEAALELAGAWRDLDWEEATAALDRIRHESQPTPPIDTLRNVICSTPALWLPICTIGPRRLSR